MDKKLEQLLRKAEMKMDVWIAAINEHNRTWFHLDEKPQDAEVESRLNKATAVLGEISDLFISYCGAKDQFDNSMMSILYEGPVLYIKPGKLKLQMRLGIDRRGLYLSSYLECIENIRFMGDDFYRQLLSLEELGEFDAPEYERYGDDVKDRFGAVFATGKSKLFRIVRSGIVAGSGKVSNPISPCLELHWPYAQGLYEAVENGCKAFKTLYKLNYELWKVSDLKNKGKW